jgi:hypothetical protein
MFLSRFLDLNPDKLSCMARLAADIVLPSNYALYTARRV